MSGFYVVSENRATVWNGWSDPIVSSSISSKLGFSFTYEKLAPTLIDQISTSNAQVVGEVVVDGIKCYRLEGRSPSGQKVKWDVAPDYGFVVVRHRTELREKEEPGSKYKAVRYEVVNSDFAQFDGVWLPRQQEAGAIYTLVDDSVTTKPMYSFKVTSLDINVTVDPGLFRPNFTADTSIYMKE